MVTINCIKRYRDSLGRVVGYQITDGNGNIRDIDANELKKILMSGEAVAVNMRLTTDGRLIPVVKKSVTNNECYIPAQDIRVQTGPKILSFKRTGNSVIAYNLLKLLFSSVIYSGINIVFYDIEANYYKPFVDSSEMIYSRITFPLTNGKEVGYYATLDKRTNNVEIKTISAGKSSNPLSNKQELKERVYKVNYNDIGKYSKSIGMDLQELNEVYPIKLQTGNYLESYEFALELKKDGFPMKGEDAIIAKVLTSIVYLKPKDTSAVKLEIPDYISDINLSAFIECRNLRAIKIPRHLEAVVKEALSRRYDLLVDKGTRNSVRVYVI